MKGIKNEAFPMKFSHLKFSFLLFYKITILPNFLKIMFYHFYVCLASVLSIVYSDFLVIDNVIRITLKVPLIRILLSIGS